MNKTAIYNVYVKIFRSRDGLGLFIGINVLVFLLINLVAILEFLFSKSTSTVDWLTMQLAVSAHLSILPYKFWTLFTFMFSQREFFHVLFNMLWLYWIGSIFLTFLNQRQFAFTYLVGGLVGGVFFVAGCNILVIYTNSFTSSSLLMGASACVMAVVIATATLVPNYVIRLLLFGDVKLKYIALVYFLLAVIDIKGTGSGGIACMAGALFGYIYIRQLQHGNDWSMLFNKFRKTTGVKTNYDEKAKQNQVLIDAILDKLSHSGYDSLTKKEKKQLFKASDRE